MDQQNYLKFLKEMNSGVLDQKNFDLNGSLDKLFALETEFRLILRSSAKGRKVFAKFINYIVKIEKNILAARIFFREREPVFFKFIPDCIRNNDAEALSEFNINYKFISWSITNTNLPQKKKMISIYNQLVSVRNHIVEQSLPLIVNRSRLYQAKTRKFKEDALEFIQTATEGFLAALDKYELAPQNNFKGVAVGRMQAQLMADHSNTVLKFSLRERRILYRANVAMYRFGMKSIKEIFAFVKQSYPDADISTLEKIIVSSNSVVSMETIKQSEINSIRDPFDNPDAESSIIEDDQSKKLHEAISMLSIIEQKVVKLVGGF